MKEANLKISREFDPNEIFQSMSDTKDVPAMLQAMLPPRKNVTVSTYLSMYCMLLMLLQ